MRAHKKALLKCMQYEQKPQCPTSKLIQLFYKFHDSMSQYLESKAQGILSQILTEGQKVNATHSQYQITHFIGILQISVLIKNQSIKQALSMITNLAISNNNSSKWIDILLALNHMLVIYHQLNSNTNHPQNMTLKTQLKYYYRTMANNHPPTLHYQQTFFPEFNPFTQVYVYQYILTVQRIATYDINKSIILFKKGLKIVQSALGKDHHYFPFLKNIIKLKQETIALLNNPVKTLKSVSSSEPKQRSFMSTRCGFHVRKSLQRPKLKGQFLSTHSSSQNGNSRNPSKEKINEIPKRNRSNIIQNFESKKVQILKLKNLQRSSGYRKKNKLILNQLGGKIINQQQRIKDSMAAIQNLTLQKHEETPISVKISSQQNQQLNFQKKIPIISQLEPIKNQQQCKLI